MTPEQILRKRPFVVPIPRDHPALVEGPIAGTSVFSLGGIPHERRTQADFLMEYNVNSHKINTIKHYPSTIMMSEGRYRAKVNTRVAIAFQEMIKTKRKTALMGNNIGMKLISARTGSKGEDFLAWFRDGWELFNMEIAADRAIDSDFITADCATYVYMNEAEGEVGWRVFSYLNGDTLYPHFDPITGEIALLGRKYTQEGDDGKIETYLDVIDNNIFATYRLSSDGADGAKNEGWVLDMQPIRHGFLTCPVAYHRRRENGPVWTASQSLSENYELGMSQFCENNLSYGLRILYTAGADFDIQTSADGTPSHITSSDSSAKLGFLEPAEGADGAFAKQLEILYKNIMRCSFTVETPEIKSGSDMSSLTVKMLFADSYIKALEDSQEYQLFLDRLVRLFKYAYFTVNGRASEINDFHVKPYLEPYIFMSETEVVNALVQLTAAGVLSRQTATEIAYNSGYGTATEWERILKEAQAELVAESTVQATATAQTSQKVNPVNAIRLDQGN